MTNHIKCSSSLGRESERRTEGHGSWKSKERTAKMTVRTIHLGNLTLDDGEQLTRDQVFQYPLYFASMLHGGNLSIS
uniref:Uncharacterized protein n=1 Tax=Arion vulgaris TaxID=1028688 RepID=A0A0B6ZJW7_9EUPU